jgi:DNA-binding MarR family transcriptional regulator
MPSEKDLKLAHQLRDALARLRRNLRKQFGGPAQLSVAEENVVRILLSQERALPSELCAQLKISSQFMSQVLHRLEEMDYINRKESATDKRKTIVSLSKKGLLRLEQRRKEKEDWLAMRISNIYNREEKESLYQALGLLGRLYEDQ